VSPAARLVRLTIFVVAVIVAAFLAGRSSTGPTATGQPSASQDPSARCELTPDVAADATIQIHDRAYGPAVTVEAGGAVAFQSLDATSHTVTEGVAGHAADNACARKRLPPHSGTVVTFHLAGDYRFTCTIHASMETTVHVR
jgi:plastocyanin